MAGRPRLYACPADGRRAANARASASAREREIVQRSVALPAACWSIIRAARVRGETLDAQTLARLLQASN